MDLCKETCRKFFSYIKNVQEEHGILCDCIFTDGNGSYTYARNITDCMTRLRRENGLNGGSITKLRKTASSDLQSKGTLDNPDQNRPTFFHS